MTKLVGITGGIASGKSTVSQMLAQAGFPVIDADQVAHQLQRPGQAGLERISATFGPAILTPAGELDRAQLGRQVFSNPDDRKRLDQLMQPLIRDRIFALVTNFKRAGVPVVILEVPLLFEQHYDDDCDLTVVVTIDQRTQLERLQKRNGYSKSAAQARIDAQQPLAKKAAQADIIIDNNGDYEQLRQQVTQLVKRLRQD